MLDDEWRRRLCMVGLDKRYNSSHGKESTKVRIAQNMGKERENSCRKLEIFSGKAHTNTRKLIQNMSMVTDVFLHKIWERKGKTLAENWRSSEERHTQTHGNLFKICQW